MYLQYHVCCTVATDVAARGLDIPKIQSVIHYDAARSPQVPTYVCMVTLLE
jgi:superfamily II DNA/RNA helicase